MNSLSPIGNHHLSPQLPVLVQYGQDWDKLNPWKENNLPGYMAIGHNNTVDKWDDKKLERIHTFSEGTKILSGVRAGNDPWIVYFLVQEENGLSIHEFKSSIYLRQITQLEIPSETQSVCLIPDYKWSLKYGTYAVWFAAIKTTEIYAKFITEGERKCEDQHIPLERPLLMILNQYPNDLILISKEGHLDRCSLHEGTITPLSSDALGPMKMGTQEFPGLAKEYGMSVKEDGTLLYCNTYDKKKDPVYQLSTEILSLDYQKYQQPTGSFSACSFIPRPIWMAHTLFVTTDRREIAVFGCQRPGTSFSLLFDPFVLKKAVVKGQYDEVPVRDSVELIDIKYLSMIGQGLAFVLVGRDLQQNQILLYHIYCYHRNGSSEEQRFNYIREIATYPLSQ